MQWWIGYIFLPLVASFVAGVLLGLAYRWGDRGRVIELETALATSNAATDSHENEPPPVEATAPAELERSDANRLQILEQQLRSVYGALENRDTQIRQLQTDLARAESSITVRAPTHRLKR